MWQHGSLIEGARIYAAPAVFSRHVILGWDTVLRCLYISTTRLVDLGRSYIYFSLKARGVLRTRRFFRIGSCIFSRATSIR